mgnify:CR=1 FL=1
MAPIKMKIVENKKFLIVDTENENRPFSRVYVFRKNSTQVKTYGIFEIEENLYKMLKSLEKGVYIELDDIIKFLNKKGIYIPLYKEKYASLKV